MKYGHPSDRAECARLARVLRAERSFTRIGISIKVNNRLAMMTLNRSEDVPHLSAREIDEAFLEAADRAPKSDRRDPLSREGRGYVAVEHRGLEVAGVLK